MDSEHKRKISESLKKSYAEGKRKPYWLGKKRGNHISKEGRKRISDANSGKLSEERKKKLIPHLKKLALARKGTKHSEDTKQRIRESNLGQKRSEETRKNISISKKGKMLGVNNPSWKGGITPERIRIWHSTKYKEWRRKVFERDDYTCQECGQRGGKLEVHHIKTFAKFPKLRLVVCNGITLCKTPCHSKTFGKEEQFEIHFMKKLSFRAYSASIS